MTPERHGRAKELFLQAIELPLDEREGFLDEACGDDLELRADVVSLVAHHTERTIIRTPSATPASVTASASGMAPWARFWRVLVLPGRRLYLAALLVLAGLAALGLLARHVMHDDQAESWRAQLHTVLSSSVHALEIWMADERNDATRCASDPLVVDLVATLLAERAVRELTSDVPSLVALRGILTHRYGDDVAFGLVDRAGDLFAASEGAVADDVDLMQMRVAPEAGTDLHRVLEGEAVLRLPMPAGSLLLGYDPDSNDPRMVVLAPVRRGEEQPVAVLGISIDPGRHFTSVLEVARIDPSGETYAVDAQGLLLSESRFDDQLRELGLLEPGQQSMLHLRALDPGHALLLGGQPDERPVLTKAAAEIRDGRSGVDVEGYRDYRGVPVIGAWTWLPEERFGVITEVDVYQAYGILEPQTVFVWCLFGLLVVSLGSLAFVTWSKSRLERALAEAGQYHLDELIGKGGMGSVYRAHHQRLRRPTAVKLLDPESMSEQSVARFEREVQLTSELTHPNTVEIYDYGRTPAGVFYYAMELLPGPTLEQLVVAEGAQPVKRVLHILVQMCSSLREAHEKNLIHRDIKPGNVILCERGGLYDVVKVLDFGLVKSLGFASDGDGDDTTATVTATGTISGTPLYMAPERIRFPRDVDARSDLYSVGAVAFKLLCGRNVFPGESSMEVLSAVLEEEAPRVSLRAPRPPPAALDELVARLLAKDPDDRPASVRDVLATLAELIAEVGPWTEDEAREHWNRWSASAPPTSGDGPSST